MIKFNSLLFVLLLIGCGAAVDDQITTDLADTSYVQVDTVSVEKKMFCNDEVRVGAERIDAYINQLKGVNVAVVGNQSSMVGETHLVDTLLGAGVNIVKVFSPEHGFRGTADAGEKVDSEVDSRTGLPIVSLYGSNKKPKASQLKGVDVLLFDIQDVGVRFYTYISTLHYVMEAAAENSKKVIVLDRPNPNGHYVDGPVLKNGFTSFVGMHEIPVVHGMTVGEYAKMINGEGWLPGGAQCELEVVACEGWDHSKFYELPVAPSPNLPNMTSVYLYPSLCFFEGTIVSVGRGTDYPFQIIGHPDYEVDLSLVAFSFTPMPNHGAKHPKLEGELCYGVDLHEMDLRVFREEGKLDLSYLADFYSNLDRGKEFFLANNFINLLAGSDQLKNQLMAGDSFETIKASWQEDLAAFKLVREKYLLYE